MGQFPGSFLELSRYFSGRFDPSSLAYESFVLKKEGLDLVEARERKKGLRTRFPTGLTSRDIDFPAGPSEFTVVLDEYLYAVGGWNRQDVRPPFPDLCDSWKRGTLHRKHLWEGPWVERASMWTPRRGAECIAAHGCIFVIGGVADDSDQAPPSEKYDPRTDTWEVLADMQIPRFDIRLAVLQDWIYAIGGLTVAQYPYRIYIERYHVPSDRWEEVRVFNYDDGDVVWWGLSARAGFHAAVFNGNIYLTGSTVDGGTDDRMGDVSGRKYEEVKYQLIPVLRLCPPQTLFEQNGIRLESLPEIEELPGLRMTFVAGAVVFGDSLYIVGASQHPVPQWRAGGRQTIVARWEKSSVQWVYLPGLPGCAAGQAFVFSAPEWLPGMNDWWRHLSESCSDSCSDSCYDN
jgi:hypothetical protein